MKRPINYLLLLLCSLLIVFLNACGGGGSASSSSKQQTDFNKSKSIEALNLSFLTIPTNIQLVGEASSGKRNQSNKSLAYKGLWANHYSPITETIDYSDRVKKNVVSLLRFVFESYDIANAPLDTLNTTGQGEIWAFKVEDISQSPEEEFKWKLSLYFRYSQTADVICRFTFENGKIKGKILENGYTFTTITHDDREETFTTYFTYDIRFDGTTIPQKLEINYVKDLREIFNFVELYWDELSEDQYEVLNLGQIGKSSVKIEYDGKEYGITGTAYSPGADLESLIRSELQLFGEEHSTYSFRAKSIVGDIDGSKMEVALPKDTENDTTDIWTKNSISKLFETNILNFMNGYLAQLLDNNDDTSLTNKTFLDSALVASVNLTGSIADENRAGVKALISILGENIAIPTLAEHGASLTTDEYNAALTFWGTSSFTPFSLTSLDEINDFLITSDTTITELQKQEVYYLTLAPLLVTQYQTTPANLTIDDIIFYLTQKGDFFSIGFKNLITANQNLYNPAFFEASKGFLGTFDGTNFYGYKLSSDALSPADLPQNFDTLNALNLESLSAIPPSAVYNLDIKVK